MSAHHLRSLRVMISRPRRTDMLAAGRLFLVSVLVPSWSLFDHDRTNVRPTSVPKPRLCPSAIGGNAVDLSTQDAALSAHRTGASTFRFPARQSCLTCRVVGTIRPVLGVWISGSRGEAPASYILRQVRAKRGFVRTGCLLALIPFSTQFAHDAEASCFINLQGGFQL